MNAQELEALLTSTPSILKKAMEAMKDMDACVDHAMEAIMDGVIDSADKKDAGQQFGATDVR